MRTVECDGGRARCAVLVTHRCNVKRRQRRAQVMAFLTAQSIVVGLAVIIGSARA